MTLIIGGARGGVPGRAEQRNYRVMCARIKIISVELNEWRAEKIKKRLFRHESYGHS
jgi:hypothetical protein